VMMRIVLFFLLLCTPALAHDPSHPELDEWFNGSHPARGYVVRSRTALLSAMLIGHRRERRPIDPRDGRGNGHPSTP
jgi:hypothetical protein